MCSKAVAMVGVVVLLRRTATHMRVVEQRCRRALYVVEERYRKVFILEICVKVRFAARTVHLIHISMSRFTSCCN